MSKDAFTEVEMMFLAQLSYKMSPKTGLTAKQENRWEIKGTTLY